MYKYYKALLTIVLLIFFIVSFFFLYPTLTISKYIVKKNSEYFIFGNNNNRIENLFYDFIIQRFYKNNFAKDQNKIINISKITKDFLVSTTEPGSYGYNLKPTYYGVSLGQVIILGHAACEGINGVLGVRLSKNFTNIELYSLFDEKKNTSPHTLLKLKNKNNEFFIDIHPEHEINFFSFQKNTNIGNNIYKNNYNEFNKVWFDNGFVIKKFDLFSYFFSLIKKILPKNTFNFLNIYKLKQNESNVSNINFNVINKNYLIDKFVEARFEHIIGNKIMADKLYNEIIETNCKYDFCKVSHIMQMKNSFL